MRDGMILPFHTLLNEIEATANLLAIDFLPKDLR